ncbi:hypothetical protein CWE15_10610 [Aliidiomarina taiwanensis]|uniref:Uncharacterized protein n=1 Tax=Aliidiomarina taiwanensis TaxID=946228 RepID=A0A432WW15_9GAMM|nr:hypothetical protein [Aliidiomarina taiwanensis]RUO37962.1 hypothetical protein CWE15_10610 [Aliidiomarina taiwanensis]
MLNLVRPQPHVQQQKRRLLLTGFCLLAFLLGVRVLFAQPTTKPHPMVIAPVQIDPSFNLQQPQKAAPEQERSSPCDLAPPLHVQVRAALWHKDPAQVRLSNASGHMVELTAGESLANTEWTLQAIQKHALIWRHGSSGCLLQHALMTHK